MEILSPCEYVCVASVVYLFVCIFSKAEDGKVSFRSSE